MRYSLNKLISLKTDSEKNAFNQLFFGVLLLLFAFGTAQAEQQVEPAKLYKLLGKAPKGTKFKPVDARAEIPFDKKYTQLTNQQKGIYRSFFKGIEVNQTPPFPKGGTQTIYKPLIKGHARIGGGGFLALKAKVNKKGEVDEVSVYLTPSDKMTELAIAVLFNTKFEPATCDGEPCEMEFPFEFELRQQFKTITSLDKENFGNSSRR